VLVCCRYIAVELAIYTYFRCCHLPISLFTYTHVPVCCRYIAVEFASGMGAEVDLFYRKDLPLRYVS
jgi:hypothetical protein